MYMPSLMPGPHCLYCYNFVVTYKIGKYEPSTFAVLFQDFLLLLFYSGFLAFPHELEDQFVNFGKIAIGLQIEITLTL